MIYFAILRECGLADKIESHSARNCFRIDPDIPSDIENHPEVFQDTIIIDKCVGTLRRFYRDIKHDDPVEFGLGELIWPDSKRHRRFIASFLNYYHYGAQTSESLLPAKEKVEGDAREMRSAEGEVKKLRDEVTRLRKSQSEGKMRAEGLRQKAEQKVQEMAHHNPVKEELDAEKAELKGALAGAQGASEELEKEIAALDARRKMLHMILNGEDINAKLAEELKELDEAAMSQRAVEPAIASKLEYAKEQNKEIAAVMKELELVSTVMAQTKALEGGNKSASWDLSSAQKQAEEADKNLMYARQRMRDVKEREAETRVKWGRKREEKDRELASFAAELDSVEKLDDEGAISGTRGRDKGEVGPKARGK